MPSSPAELGVNILFSAKELFGHSSSSSPFLLQLLPSFLKILRTVHDHLCRGVVEVIAQDKKLYASQSKTKLKPSSLHVSPLILFFFFTVTSWK